MTKKRDTGLAKKALLVLLIGMFLYSGFQLVSTWLEYRQNQEAYEATREEFVVIEMPERVEPVNPPDAGIPHAGGEVPDQTYTGPLWDLKVSIDFNGLRTVNREVIGWIMVPDTAINYPIMKAADNQKYLTRALNGRYNKLGSIFMDYRNRSDYSDPNTIIYGHYTKNGSMFGSLHAYKKEEYLDAHRYVYIITEEGTRIYEIFSAKVADVDDDVFNFDLKKDPEYKDILTLSTCTTSGRVNERFVIQGKRIYEEGEAGGAGSFLHQVVAKRY